MNKNNEALKEKGVKQTWLSKQLETVTEEIKAMCKTDISQDYNFF
jgi:hypothetical protein